jgi:hypothetical protein
MKYYITNINTVHGEPATLYLVYVNGEHFWSTFMTNALHFKSAHDANLFILFYNHNRSSKHKKVNYSEYIIQSEAELIARIL